MKQEHFNNLMWSEIVKEGKEFLPNQDCVCAKIEGLDVFLICAYHQEVLRKHNESSDYKTSMESTK